MKKMNRSLLLATLTTAFVAIVSLPACSTEIEDEENVGETHEQALVTFQGRQYQLQTIRGSAAQWGCGASSPSYGPLSLNGFTIKGRVRCLFESIRGSNPQVFTGLGGNSLASNELGSYYNLFKFNGNSGPKIVWTPDASGDGFAEFTFFAPLGANATKNVGETCSSSSECRSNICKNGKCVSPDGGSCQVDANCNSGFCNYGRCESCDNTKRFIPQRQDVITRCVSRRGATMVNGTQHFPCKATHSHGAYVHPIPAPGTANGCQVRREEAVRCEGELTDVPSCVGATSAINPACQATTGTYTYSGGRLLIP